MMSNCIITVSIFLGIIGQADYSKLQDIKPTQFAKAPGYSEGPTWKNGELFFCSGSLLRVSKEGKVEKFLDINPAGTVLNAKGHLLICDNKHKAILDYAPDGSLHVLADSYENKPLNSLNDLTLDAKENRSSNDAIAHHGIFFLENQLQEFIEDLQVHLRVGLWL